MHFIWPMIWGQNNVRKKKTIKHAPVTEDTEHTWTHDSSVGWATSRGCQGCAFESRGSAYVTHLIEWSLGRPRSRIQAPGVVCTCPRDNWLPSMICHKHEGVDLSRQVGPLVSVCQHLCLLTSLVRSHKWVDVKRVFILGSLHSTCSPSGGSGFRSLNICWPPSFGTVPICGNKCARVIHIALVAQAFTVGSIPARFVLPLCVALCPSVTAQSRRASKTTRHMD